MQLNEGLGGCFPMHFDTTAAISARTLTVILCARAPALACLLACGFAR